MGCVEEGSGGYEPVPCGGGALAVAGGGVVVLAVAEGFAAAFCAGLVLEDLLLHPRLMRLKTATRSVIVRKHRICIRYRQQPGTIQ